MLRLLLICSLALAPASLTQAQLTPPSRPLAPIRDPAMVIMDRGTRLEVLPHERATAQADSVGQRVHHVVSSSSNAPITSDHLGVVFNHTMQQRGYITGEIAFKVTGSGVFRGSSTLYPGLKKLPSKSVYEVQATSPGQFILLLKHLQSRHDLEWVEPVIIYGPGAVPSAQ